jgi:hypothetical protein
MLSAPAVLPDREQGDSNVTMQYDDSDLNMTHYMVGPPALYQYRRLYDLDWTFWMSRHTHSA